MALFVDLVKIRCQAGNGGDGAVSFHREKYVPDGGPDGGDGGHGGNIVFVGDRNMHTLMDFRYTRVFRAPDGENGKKGLSTGKSGSDLRIKVPLGTVVRDMEGHILADISEDQVARVLLRGGRGGWGNARFKSSVQQAPNYAKPGERTREVTFALELKSIADVGLVGFPNAGKSTLLSVCTAARPKIANYPFTTLLPNLGVVRVGHDGFVMADIPGLVEGASEGTGLGHAFLRHVERTRFLLHVVDAAGSEGRDPVEDVRVIDAELSKYGDLAKRPRVLVANKIDLPEAQEHIPRLREAFPELEIFEISAATHQGVDALIAYTAKRLEEIEPIGTLEEEIEMIDVGAEEPYRVSKENGVYCVRGPLVDRILRQVNLEDETSLAWFQRALRKYGIIEALRAAGTKEGDTVALNDLEFDFVD